MATENTSVIKVVLDANQAKAQAADLDSSLDKIGKSGAAAGTAASGGLSQTEQALNKNRQAQQTLGIEIAKTKQEMATLNLEIQKSIAAIGRDAAETKELVKDYAMLDGQVRLLRADKEALRASSIPLSDAVKAESLAARTAAASQAMLGASAEATGGKWNQLTTRISTGKGVLAGYDAAIEGVVRSMGGIQLGWAVAIGLATTLLPKIISLAVAKRDLGEAIKEVVKLNDEAIAQDILALQVSQVTSNAANEQVRVERDLNALLSQYVELSKIVAEAKRNEAAGIERANLHLKSGNLIYDEGQASGAKYAASADDVAKATSKLTEDVLDSEAALHKNVQELIKFGAQTGMSETSLLAHARSLNLNSDALAMLERDLNAGALALARFQIQLNKLQLPQFDVSRTGAGIQAQAQAVLKGLEDIRLGSVQAAQLGIKGFDDQVRVLSPTLRGLSNDLKQNKGEMASLEPVVRQMVLRYRELEESHKKDTSAAKAHAQALREEGAAFQLQKELSAAMTQLGKQDFDKQRELIKQEFEDRRVHLAMRKQLTEETSALLLALELAALTRINNEEVAHYEAERKRRLEQLEHSRKIREQDTEDLRQHLTRQRNMRIEEEEKFFKEQDKLERARRVDRPGRAAMQADAFAQQSADVERVSDAFGRASRNARVFQAQLRALDRFDKGDMLGGLRASIQAVALDFLESGRAAEEMGGLIEGAFSAAVASGDNFIRTLGASLVEGMTQIIAQVLGQIGIMLISKGISDILMGIAWNANPLTPGAGSALIAAGTSEVIQGSLFSAAAGVVKGLGALAGNAIRGDKQSGASASGATNATPAPGQPNPQTPPKVISFPTSPATSQPMALSVNIDRRGFKDALDGHEVVFEGMFRGGRGTSIEMVRRVRKIAKSG
jgi:hypothetical protein